MAKIIPQGIDIHVSFSSYLQFSDCFPRWWDDSPFCHQRTKVPRPSCPQARPAGLICSVSAWGWSPGSAALESAFPSRLLDWNVFTCLSMSCSSVNCLFMSTFLLALNNLFVVHFQEPLFYYRHSSFICRRLYKYLFFQIYHLHIVCLWLLFPQNICYSCRAKWICPSRIASGYSAWARRSWPCPAWVLTACVGLAAPLVSAFTYSIRLALTLTHCAHSSYRRLSTAPAPLSSWAILSTSSIMNEVLPRVVTASSISVLGQGLFAYS